MAIHLRTWGDLARFTRHEMKVERVSYSVITHSAARGQFRVASPREQSRGAD